MRPLMRASFAIPPVAPVAPSLKRTLFVIGSRPKPAAVLPADWLDFVTPSEARGKLRKLPRSLPACSFVTDRRTSHLVRYARPPPRALVFIPRARAREPGRRRASPARSPPSRGAIVRASRSVSPSRDPIQSSPVSAADALARRDHPTQVSHIMKVTFVAMVLMGLVLGANAGAVDLTAKNFDAEVLESGKSAFVKFLAPWYVRRALPFPRPRATREPAPPPLARCRSRSRRLVPPPSGTSLDASIDPQPPRLRPRRGAGFPAPPIDPRPAASFSATTESARGSHLATRRGLLSRPASFVFFQTFFFPSPVAGADEPSRSNLPTRSSSIAGEATASR